MPNLPAPSVETRDRLIERLGGPQPENIALMDFIYTLFEKTDFANFPLDTTGISTFLGINESGLSVKNDLSRAILATTGIPRLLAIHEDGKIRAFGFNRTTTDNDIDTDAYDSGHGTGLTADAAYHNGIGEPGKELYAFFRAYIGPGSGDPAVLSTAFAAGFSALKENYYNTTVPGQVCTLNLVNRAGYHGSDANVAPSGYSYNPAGDGTTIIANAVQSSEYGQIALMEGTVYFAKDGVFDSTIKNINVQLGAMRQKNPDGSVANKGIGLALAAANGSVGYAIQVVNAKRVGSYEYAPGEWEGFARYNRDDGTNDPYDAFLINQNGSITMSQPGTVSSASKRTIDVSGGLLRILDGNGAYITRWDQPGNMYMNSVTQIVIGSIVALKSPNGGYGGVTNSGSIDKTGIDAIGVYTLAQLTAKVAALWEATYDQRFIHS